MVKEDDKTPISKAEKAEKSSGGAMESSRTAATSFIGKTSNMKRKTSDNQNNSITPRLY
jgi:hypothetical protein